MQFPSTINQSAKYTENKAQTAQISGLKLCFIFEICMCVQGLGVSGGGGGGICGKGQQNTQEPRIIY